MGWGLGSSAWLQAARPPAVSLGQAGQPVLLAGPPHPRPSPADLLSLANCSPSPAALASPTDRLPRCSLQVHEVAADMLAFYERHAAPIPAAEAQRLLDLLGLPPLPYPQQQQPGAQRAQQRQQQPRQAQQGQRAAAAAAPPQQQAQQAPPRR